MANNVKVFVSLDKDGAVSVYSNQLGVEVVLLDRTVEAGRPGYVAQTMGNHYEANGAIFTQDVLVDPEFVDMAYNLIRSDLA